MRALAILFGFAILCGLVTAGMPARADSEKVPLEKVPKAVIDALKAKYPRAQIRNAATELEEGKTVYELAFTYQKHNYDVTFTPEGKIVYAHEVTGGLMYRSNRIADLYTPPSR